MSYSLIQPCGEIGKFLIPIVVIVNFVIRTRVNLQSLIGTGYFIKEISASGHIRNAVTIAMQHE